MEVLVFQCIFNGSTSTRWGPVPIVPVGRPTGAPTIGVTMPGAGASSVVSMAWKEADGKVDAVDPAGSHGFHGRL